MLIPTCVVLDPKNLACMREMAFVARSPDGEAVLDLSWGFPMAGLARHCPSLVQRLSKPPMPLSTCMYNLAEHSLKVLASVRSTGDSQADALAWSKCEKEFESGGLLGPWEAGPGKFGIQVQRWRVIDRNFLKN